MTIMALKQGDSSVQLKARLPDGLMVVFIMFLDAYPKDIPFLFIYKKEKGNLTVGPPRDRWVHHTLL